MFKAILFMLAAAIVAFLAYVALQPAEGTISRSATMGAPTANVFAEVNDFHKWQDWSPWAKLDPNATTSFEGAPAGQGAIFNWAGNSEIGEGKMTIIESRPNEAIKIKLDFAKPFAGTSHAHFTFKPEGSGTLVTWTMTGERPFLARVMCTLFNADKMVGGQFEKGLANLKAIVEGPAKT